ncbi:MAG: hypothetical protein EXR86_12475, partial [Gammaproteobacteria bacterium]|nr:hypothetical protein [Gammaproteobacteria bacterium]
MTVNNPSNSTPVYVGNGATTVYGYSFQIYEASNMVVTQTDTGGVATVLTLTTHYTLSGVGSRTGGNITLVAALPTGYTLVGRCVLPITQGTDLRNQGNFFAETHETVFDRLTKMVQQVYEVAQRAIRLPSSEVGSDLATTLPSIAGRASKFLAFDGSGNVIAAAGTSANLGPVSAFINTMLDDADSATARATLQIPGPRTVLMCRTVDGGSDPTLNPATWVVYKPDGSLLNISGSTTMGLQEAINYAAQYGYDLYVHGGGIKPEIFNVPYGGALGNNPFATTNGSAVVTVTHTAHGLSTGHHIRFTGLSGAVNGIPAAEFDPSELITVLSANTYTITLTTPATSAGSGGGAACRFQHAGQDVAIIHCTSAIEFPPIQNKSIRFGAVSLIIDGAHAAGMRFDSCMMVNFEFNGQLITSNSAIAVHFDPTKELPLDPVKAITASQFRFKTIGTNGGTNPVCVQFNVGTEGILSNRFEFGETNSFGIAGSIGIQVTDAAVGKVFRENSIFCYNLHGQRVVGLRAGITSGARIGGNIWDVFQFANQGALTTTFLTWGRNDIIRLVASADAHTVTECIKLEASAAGNVFTVVSWPVLVTTLVNDQATAKSNTIITATVHVEANKNGTNQTGVVTATQTDVTFSNELSDTLSNFDGTTFTAPLPGIYEIAARTSWVGTGDQAHLTTSIWKNGSILAESGVYASSAGGAQGATICRSIRLAAGDT